MGRVSWDEKIYALYKGEENLVDGTIQEIAEKTGRKIDSIKYMTYPIYAKRASKSENRMIMVLIENED